MNNSTPLGCPVCKSTNFKFWRTAYDDRYGNPTAYALSTCSECNHLMTVPRLSEKDLPSLYEKYYPRKNVTAASIIQSIDTSPKIFKKISRWFFGVNNQGQYLVKSGDKLLDVGCGSGGSLLEAKSLGAEAYGIEADPNVARLAKELGLQIHQGSIFDNPFPGKFFDLIIMNQVIEHIPEPDVMLAFLADRLTPAGRLILVFPNIDSIWRCIFRGSWINWHVPYHQHHFNKRTMKTLVGRCGYQILRSRTITPNLWTFLQVRAIFSRVELGIANPLWIISDATTKHNSPSRSISLRQIIANLILFLLAIPLRVFDSLGLGDSLMIELVRVKQV